MAHRWYQQAERGSPFALRLIRGIALRAGRPAARAFLYPIAIYFFLRARAQRQASQNYLRRLLGKRPAWHQVVRHIHCFAATILDRVFLLTDRFSLFDIRVHNAEVLLDYAAAGQGCLLLGGHLGSFEVLRALAAEKKIPVKILMYPEHNRSLTGVLMELNPALQDTVIPLGNPYVLIEVKEHLSKGWMIGMLGDRAGESDRVTACRFLGARASFPQGPAKLAAAAGVPVIFFAGLYRGGKRYDIFFELLSPGMSVAREQREAFIEEWTQRFADRLAHYARQAPYNWFNFYVFWDEE
jgi:predicted LPLAT superfamily acyltransferase